MRPRFWPTHGDCSQCIKSIRNVLVCIRKERYVEPDIRPYLVHVKCTVMDRSLGRHILRGQFLNTWVKSSNSFSTIIILYLGRCNIFIFEVFGWAINFIWLNQILSLFPVPPFLGTCTFSRSLSQYLFKIRSCYLWIPVAINVHSGSWDYRRQHLRVE